MHELLIKVQQAQTPAELWDLYQAYFRARGIEKISYHHYGGQGAGWPSQPAITINASGFADDWVCHYVDQKLFLIDPITELARSTTHPFLWSEINTLMHPTPEQKKYLDEMEEADLGDGIAFQVYGPGMRNGYVGLGFGHDGMPFTRAQLLEFQCVAQAGHIRYCEMTEDQMAPPPTLSPREREVLSWIARGKSNAVIADIIGVSPHTIDTQVRRIFEKLGVADRTTAAIRGVGAGLVLPSG